MDTYELTEGARRRRRRHTAEFKQAVVTECLRPGVSIAAIAMNHRLNANMLRKWVIEAEQRDHNALPPANPSRRCETATEAPAFVPISLSSNAGQRDIHIQWKRDGATLTITWPAALASDCTAWLHEIMR